MTHDPADRMVEPGARPSTDVRAVPDVSVPDVSEADALEQALRVDRGADTDVFAEPMPADANPDDVAEQRLEVPIDDDDYPMG